MTVADKYVISKIKPAPGYMVILPLEVQTKTDSGIYLPDAAGEKPQKGEVLVVGDEEVTDKGIKRTSFAKEGDVVIYKEWMSNKVKINGTEYLFAKFEDVLAVEKK